MSMIKPIVSDYVVAVVNPHLKGLVRDIKIQESKEKKMIRVRVWLDPADHKRSTHGRPSPKDLETLTAMLVDSLSRVRFGYTCPQMEFKSTADG